MQKTGIPQRETQLISNLYFKQRAKIRGKEILSEGFPIEKGVRQGCILSPILFNLYSEMLIKDALQDEDGIKFNGESITTIRYADDTAILAETEEDLQRMMDKIHQHCKNYGMNHNLKKTKTLVINKKDAEKKVQK